jgi:hypothetical protein
VCPYSLDREELIISQLWSFQGAHGMQSRQQRTPPAVAAGLSKLNSKRLHPKLAADVEVDVDLGEPRITDDQQCHRNDKAGITRWAASGVQELRDP